MLQGQECEVQTQESAWQAVQHKKVAQLSVEMLRPYLPIPKVENVVQERSTKPKNKFLKNGHETNLQNSTHNWQGHA